MRNQVIIINQYTIWRHIKYILAQFIYIIIPAVISLFMDNDKTIIIFCCLFGVFFVVYFFNKKRNQVYFIKFDNDTKIVTIKQFKQLIRKETYIKYLHFSSRIETINFGYSIMNTLVIRDKSEIVAMIGIKNWFNWKEDDLKVINNLFSMNSKDSTSEKES